jgi:inorganic triphosphatase YgiF
MTEVELKFQVPPDARNALRDAVMARQPTRIHLRARYFDRADGTLARSGISLRLRLEDGVWVQTLKAPARGAADRQEHEVQLDTAASAEPDLDIARHAGTEAGARLLSALGSEKATGLQESHRTDVVRHALLLRTRHGIVELALDTGHIEAAGRSRPVHEIEFELKRGSPADVVTAALPWVRRHGLWLDAVSKGERGHLLAQGRAHADAARAASPKTVPEAPEALAREVVTACLGQILRNASEVAGGSGDPDHVHQLRVGLRRLRTALQELAPLDACLDPEWEAPLVDAFRELGRHRDQTLLDTGTGKALVDAGAPRVKQAAAATPAVDPAAVVKAWPLQDTLLALLAYTLTPPGPVATAFEGDAIDAISTRLDALQRKLRKSAKRFTTMSVDDQHSVRKRLKRLRYLSEFIAPAFRNAKVSDFFDHLKPAQDALGEHNDEASALVHFQSRTSDDPHAWFAVGWLTARQARSAEKAAKVLQAAGRAEPFWQGKRR